MSFRSLIALATVGLFAVAAFPATAAEDPAAAEPLVGDPDAGERPFKKCLTCHTTEEGGKNKVGPNLWAIMGRTAGTVEKFRYSKAMKESGIVWDWATMDGYLENPRKYLKGGKMAFPGVRKPQERADVIAHLEKKTTAAAAE